MRHQRTIGLGIVCGLLAVLAVDGWSGVEVYRLSQERAALERDVSTANGIEYGLLSVDAWMQHLRRIIVRQIDHFSLTPAQERILREQLVREANAILSRVEQLQPSGLKGKLQKAAVGALIPRKEIPELVDAALAEAAEPRTRHQVKRLALQKLDEYAEQTRDNNRNDDELAAVYARHHVTSRAELNGLAAPRADSLRKRVRVFVAVLVASLFACVLAWGAMYRRSELARWQKPLFALSLALAMVTLLASLGSPMIEIDARIRRIDFVLLGEHVQFDNQVLFYQSKSILQVVRVLLTAKQADSIFVGVLILLFSVLLPIAKLVCSELMLLSTRLRDNRVVRVLALKTGKWSMADVLVVAIFMAYVGFKAILDSQLGDLNVHTASLTSITTNDTSLQPAFILFVSFVLFGLLLAELMRRASRTKD
jgi:hypothetical protein